MTASIQEHFSPLEDPRIERNKRHQLMAQKRRKAAWNDDDRAKAVSG